MSYAPRCPPDSSPPRGALHPHALDALDGQKRRSAPRASASRHRIITIELPSASPHDYDASSGEERRPARPDLSTRADLRVLVEDFYVLLLADPRIAPVFEHLDLQAHFPVLVDFWALLLLGELGYARNAFQKHVPLAIEARHFPIWLAHFEAALEARWSGPRRELATRKAREIAALFESKFRAQGRFG